MEEYERILEDEGNYNDCVVLLYPIYLDKYHDITEIKSAAVIEKEIEYYR